MNKEEYSDEFLKRAKQDIKMCEKNHELEAYVAGLLENIDYWQNEYDYMKKYRDNLQQELKKKNKIIEEQNTKIKDFTDFSLEIYKSYFHHTKDMWLNELLHNYFDDINYGTDFKLEELEKGSEE